MKFTKKHQKSSVQFSLSECIDIPCIVISIKRGKSSRIVKEILNASLMPVSMQFYILPWCLGLVLYCVANYFVKCCF